MLIQHTHYPTGHNCDRPENSFSHTFPKKIQNTMINYFKGLLMTHNLDIFMSGKNLGLNGVEPCQAGTHTRLLTELHIP